MGQFVSKPDRACPICTNSGPVRTFRIWCRKAVFLAQPGHRLLSGIALVYAVIDVFAARRTERRVVQIDEIEGLFDVRLKGVKSLKLFRCCRPPYSACRLKKHLIASVEECGNFGTDQDTGLFDIR